LATIRAAANDYTIRSKLAGVILAIYFGRPAGNQKERFAPNILSTILKTTQSEFLFRCYSDP
jgi:hypothetical protein